tara:strand:- start:3045 stop:3479 length:435 start_codon:yes stop_codon:yes gene_type:complete
MTTTTEKASLLAEHIGRRFGVTITADQANTLRRANVVLCTWGEKMCGGGNDYSSWCTVRDDDTGKTYVEHHPLKGKSYRTPTPDQETAALVRVADVCKAVGLVFHHQTDPRGEAVYVGTLAALEGTTVEQGYSCRMLCCGGVYR